VVIGGGIAGASVAYELAATRSVVLLEAETELARHSTARSAASYVPGHGASEVRALIAASGPRFAELAWELDAPPLLTPRAVLWLAADATGERALAAMLGERVGEPDAPTPIDPRDALRRCPALLPDKVRAAALTADAADLDAMALHAGYVRGLRRRGGVVCRAAPVTALSLNGASWLIQAGDDELETPEIVDAAGAWADAVAELAGVPRIGLTSLRRTIAVAPVAEPDRLRPRDGGPLPMVIEAGERFYFKAEGQGLLISPGDESPAEPGDAQPAELDVATALERVEAVTGLGLRSIRTSWAGLRSFVPDRLPVVGAWPDHPGFHFLAGQGGSGIESGPALAALAAAIITGTPTPVDISVDPAVFAPRTEVTTG
jgi:D-arginine dehydrogenase